MFVAVYFVDVYFGIWPLFAWQGYAQAGYHAILMALLFQFGLEQRSMETGTLLALGFTPPRVRRLRRPAGPAQVWS